MTPFPLAPSDPPASDDLEDFCPPQYRAAAIQLIPLLYSDLKKIARRERGRHVPQHTMSTTVLVHDAYLRLAGQREFESHAHFLRVAAITMRHLLIDRARAQLSAKKGGELTRVGMEQAEDFFVEEDQWVLSVHDALIRLGKFSPRLAEIVEGRFFAGYGDKEIAQALGIGERTVQRDWALARAWLRRELGSDADRIG